MDKTYYEKMLDKNRLIPFFKGDRLVCTLSFYICNKGEEGKYFRENMWSVEEDDENGNLCIIDHLLTDKHPDNPKLSYEIWHRFRTYIKSNFPKVEKIRWNRFKDNKVNVLVKLQRGIK